MLWHEAVSLAELGAQDRKFLTRTDDADKVGVIFGNGKRGQRLPTGRENVKALYRSGIGKPGNVKAGQISLLASRPLGVKDVINPVRASGGAGREEAAAIRKNAPTALFALDRLLSTSDYADFARSFGGIGKAAAARESDGRRSLVNVVIAGVDDAPIDATSDVFRNLKAALQRFGDPQVPVRLAVRERLALVMSVGVRIDPDYLWEAVEPKIRAAMLDVFSFDHAELGVPLFLATAMRTIQAIKGVTYADIDVFDSLSEGQLLAGFDKALAPGLCAQQRISVKPNQLAWLTPDVPDTLILQEIKS